MGKPASNVIGWTHGDDIGYANGTANLLAEKGGKGEVEHLVPQIQRPQRHSTSFLPQADHFQPFPRSEQSTARSRHARSRWIWKRWRELRKTKEDPRTHEIHTRSTRHSVSVPSHFS